MQLTDAEVANIAYISLLEVRRALAAPTRRAAASAPEKAFASRRFGAHRTVLRASRPW